MPASPRATTQDTISNREQIMQAAELLFAEKGIDSVSLNEINKAAGQKNTSALHYHFGNKQGLVQAIVYRHYETIETRLQAALDELAERPDFSLRDLVICTITPFVEQLDSRQGINYLLIVAQLLNKSTDLLLVGHPDQIDKARTRAFRFFEVINKDLPGKIAVSRLVLFSSLLFHSLASYAQFARGEERNPLGSKPLFVANLVDSLVALVEAPVSKSTRQLVDSEKS